MFWLKACPRCKGDLYLDVSSRGKDIVCLQCGYRRYILFPDDYRARKGLRYNLRTPHYQEQDKNRVPVTL
jgi:uncharacterized protein YbaR (Trm112 family)